MNGVEEGLNETGCMPEGANGGDSDFPWAVGCLSKRRGLSSCPIGSRMRSGPGAANERRPRRTAALGGENQGGA